MTRFARMPWWKFRRPKSAFVRFVAHAFAFSIIVTAALFVFDVVHLWWLFG